LFSKDRPHCRHQEPGCEEDLFDAVATIRKTCEDLNESMTHVSLAWLLAQDAVTSVIAGARNAAQAAQNAAAASLELPGEAIKKLSAATDSIKAYAGTNADLWESQSRMDRRQAPADGKGAE
jgi:aryl-alcohol dehydrogenase-like predicted oxidoreductase